MAYDYRFTNLCGQVHTGGNVTFTTPDGNSILSPVGNRITVFDLVKHNCYTLPCENRMDIRCIAISHCGRLVISVDVEGHALVINLPRRMILHRFHFKKPVRSIVWSPDDSYIAVSHGHKLQVWRAPSLSRSFAPFVLHRTYTGHFDDITSIDWSDDGQFILTGSKDATARIYTTHPTPGFVPVTLSGHKEGIIGAWFGDNDMIFTVSQDAACLQWTWQEMQGLPMPHADTTLPGDDQASVASADSSASSSASASSASSASSAAPAEPELLQPTGAVVQRGALAAQQRREVHAVPDPSASAYGDMSVAHGTWRCVARHYFNMDHARVHAADLHKASGLLVVGFDSGVFGLYMLPDCSAVHSLSMGRARITSACINASGDWIAFASAPAGALLVWEWQSESYVLKQAGHRQAVQAVAWSPDGSIMASGGDDGKIKLWNTHTGFCYVTFTDHTGPITSLTFMGGAGGRGVALVSASLDGTVRAFDCVRYRNFRTLAAPDMPQFVSVAVDAAGELVAAGGADPFNIYVWSLATGKLLDVLAGHEGPIPCLAFKPDASALASVSWDRTMRVWDVFGSGGTRETFDHPSDVLGVAWRPDGKQIVTASREGALHLWDPERGQGLGSIDVRRDAAGGRRKSTTQTAADDSATKHFSTVAYTSDGQCVLAGGRSKWVALYAVEPRLLLRKWQITHNVSLDGVRDKFSSASIGVLGVDKADIDFGRDEEQEGKGAWSAAALPGAARAAQGHRSTPPEARTRAVALAPTGRAWCAAVPGGVAVYSLDEDMRFDPFELDEDATPASVRTAIVHKEWSKALALALHLGEREPLHWAMTTVPNDALALVAAALPRVFVPRLLHWLGEALASQTAIERSLRWTVAVLTSHAPALKARSPAILAGLRAVQRGMAASCDKVLELAESNTYQLEFLALAQAAQGLLASETNKLEVSREATEAATAAHSVAKMRAGMFAGAMFE